MNFFFSILGLPFRPFIWIPLTNRHETGEITTFIQILMPKFQNVSVPYLVHGTYQLVIKFKKIVIGHEILND
jgi:hypothetical protein